MDKPTEIQVSENVRVKPTGMPFRCVICNGFGSLSYGKKVCQACNGKGYILVPVEEVKK